MLSLNEEIVLSLIEELVYEEMAMNEAALTMDYAQQKHIALSIFDQGRTKVFVLYKPKDFRLMLRDSERQGGEFPFKETVVGFVELQWKQDCKAWELSHIAGEKGFGPLMFDIAMSAVSPQFIKSDEKWMSADIRKVWNYALTNRSDEYKVANLNGCDPFKDLNRLGQDPNLNKVMSIKAPLNYQSLLNFDKETRAASVRDGVSQSYYSDCLKEAGWDFFHMKYD